MSAGFHRFHSITDLEPGSAVKTETSQNEFTPQRSTHQVRWKKKLEFKVSCKVTMTCKELVQFHRGNGRITEREVTLLLGAHRRITRRKLLKQQLFQLQTSTVDCPHAEVTQNMWGD